MTGGFSGSQRDRLSLFELQHGTGKGCISDTQFQWKHRKESSLHCTSFGHLDGDNSRHCGISGRRFLEHRSTQPRLGKHIVHNDKHVLHCDDPSSGCVLPFGRGPAYGQVQRKERLDGIEVSDPLTRIRETKDEAEALRLALQESATPASFDSGGGTELGIPTFRNGKTRLVYRPLWVMVDSVLAILSGRRERIPCLNEDSRMRLTAGVSVNGLYGYLVSVRKTQCANQSSLTNRLLRF
jgi:hypothetical protein